jgi:phosphoglycolate phosphatase-like HAD superfamily hydrolase
VKRCIVLFDIDGTLLTFDGSPPGPGRTALDRAMRALFGVERATEGMRVAGGTDIALARTLLTRAGERVDDAEIARLLSAYLRELQLVLEGRRYRPIGDVEGCVSALRTRGAVVGLATGNLREGARHKLTSAGIDQAFDLELGGYGSDAELRADIVRAGALRCGASAGDALVVVGDTEFDVSAGRAVGARVVGVAHTDEARAELVRAGADVVVPCCGEALVEAVFLEKLD